MKRFLSQVFPYAFAMACGVVVPAHATDYYFNSTTRRIEQANGTAFSPQAVAGVSAVLTGGLPGVDQADAVEFTFGTTLNFSAADKVFFKGSKPVRIRVTGGNIVIPAGMLVDASGSVGGAGGGLSSLALGVATGGSAALPNPGGIGGAGGAGGGTGAYSGDSGMTGEQGYVGRPYIEESNDPGTGLLGRAGGDGFGAPDTGGKAYGTTGGSSGNFPLASGGDGSYDPGSGGTYYYNWLPGQHGAAGKAGNPGRPGANGGGGESGQGGGYNNPTGTLKGGGGGASGSGGGGGGSGGGGGGGSGGGGGARGSYLFIAGDPGGKGGNGGAGGIGTAGSAGGNGGAGGAGGGAFELRASGTISIGGTLRANGANGTAGPVPVTPTSSAGQAGGAGGLPSTSSPDRAKGGTGGAGGAGGTGGAGGKGGNGGHGGGGAGGTIILRSDINVIEKLSTGVLEAKGGTAGGAGAGAGQAGLVIQNANVRLIGQESFSYAAGTHLNTQTGGTNFNWNSTTQASSGPTSAWSLLGSGNSAQVTAAGTLLTNNTTAARRFNGTETDGQVSPPGAVYYKVELTQRAGATSSEIVAIRQGTSKIWFGVLKNPGNGALRFGIRELLPGNSISYDYTTLVPVTGRRYTLVCKVDFAANRLVLWLDPKLGHPEAESTPILSRAISAPEPTSAVGLQSEGEAEWDNLAVASVWEGLSVTVNTLGDENDGSLSPTAGSGNGITLREAVAHAPAGSVINFSPNLAGKTVPLGSQLPVTRSLVIDGSELSPGMTLSGNSDGDGIAEAGETRHFDLAAAAADLRLTGLTLADGQATGSGHGGSIAYTAGRLAVERCAFFNNRSSLVGEGGAIQVEGIFARIGNSTFIGNTGGYGGGIYIETGASANLSHLTLMGNASDSGAGITNFGTMALNASIVAENDGAEVSGSFTGSGNLIDVETLLEPLGDYGGPTLSRPPRAGSPALDMIGSTDSLGLDQRGYARATDGDGNGSVAEDAGAVEASALIMVTTTGESTGGLRAALDQAAILTSARIGFAPGVFNGGATITLNGNPLNLPVVPGGLFIDASNLAAPVTIDGANLSQVLVVPAEAVVRLSNLKVTGGNNPSANAGGGIHNEGDLTLNRCVITRNHGGGGGGVSSIGNLAISDSTISRNTAHAGGGLYIAGGSAVIERSTISGNIGRGLAGGIFCYPYVLLRMSQCTVAENTGSLDGGIAATSLFMEHCTVTRNAGESVGGVHSNGPTLRGCVIAGNHSSGAPDLSSADAPVFSDSILGDNSGSGLGPVANSIGTNVAPIDPRLSALGSYGGPTETVLPLPGSPLLNRISSGGPAADQRGIGRPVGGGRDIGAVEVTPTDYFIVTSTADSGSGSLRQILDGSPEGGLIVFHPAAFTGGSANRIALASQLNSPARRLTVYAGSVGGVTLDAGRANFRILTNPSGANLTLEAMTLRGGRQLQGAAIINNGTLALKRCLLTDNRSTSHWGAITNNASILLDRCTITGNQGQGDGGVMFNFSSATVRECTITDNVAQNNGGAFFNVGTLILANSIVAGNYINTPDTPNEFAGDPPLSLGGNLIGANTQAGYAAADGDLLGTAAAPLDPKLAPLAPRGGPTETRPPLPGSPALDAANSALDLTALDQRGFSRHRSSEMDIGAVERGPVITFTGLLDSGTSTLSQTVADAREPDTRIKIGTALNGTTIALPGQLGIASNRMVEIDASDLPAGITLQGPGYPQRVVDNKGVLSLHKLTLRNGSSDGQGGGIASSGVLLAADCSVTNNATVSQGGGMALIGGVTDVIRSTISANGAHGIYQQEGLLRLDRCTIAGNGVEGISISAAGRTELRHCTVMGNGSISALEVSDAASLFLAHSIVSQIAGSFTDAGATISTGGPNLIGNNAMVAAVFPAGPLAGTAATPLDLGLAPLQDYGGLTGTMALRPGSPARNAATGSYLTRDQRGFPVIGVPDLGAYEAGHIDDNFNSYIWETLPNSATEQQHAATSDYDGDGKSNGDEYLAGTQAGNPASYVRVLSTGQVGQDLVINFATVPGRKYYVERSTDGFATWQYLDTGGPHTASGTTLTMALSILPDTPSAFFRVVVNK